MSQTISGSPPYVAPYFYAQAFAGMLADSTDVKDVNTFACDVNPIPFGVVVGRTAANSMKVGVGGTMPVGLSIHDHLIASRGQYNQYDAVSVLTRGRAWALLDATTTGVLDGAPVYFVPATGAASATATGNTAIPRAIFRSPPASVFNLLGGAAVNVAVIEFNYPML